MLFAPLALFARESDELNITAGDFKEKFSADSSIVILDVRMPQELVGPLGKIEGVINIPVQILSENLGKLDGYKSKEIFVICRSGNRSVFARDILLKNGFKGINVLGGMRAYNKE